MVSMLSKQSRAEHQVVGADGVGRAAVFSHELAVGAVDVVGGRAADGAADAPAFGIVISPVDVERADQAMRSNVGAIGVASLGRCRRPEDRFNGSVEGH
jgi:hypothetical protein